jgi:imidazole glycerol-phosphate synthase subunit HisH
MKIGVVDYEGGNLASVAHAVSHLGYSPIISSDTEVLKRSDKIIFPGVGAAGATMAALEKSGLKRFIIDTLPELNIPCLGICIGIQVLFEKSEEDNEKTLGIIKGEVKKFDSNDNIKIPHIGWNTVHFTNLDDPLLNGVEQDDYFYFVNSFYVVPDDSNIVLGTTQYGNHNFATLIRYKHWVASQFHLEKSGEAGLLMLKNFLEQP